MFLSVYVGLSDAATDYVCLNDASADQGEVGRVGRQVHNSLFILNSRAGEPANFLAAPAPDFFIKRLRLRLPSPAK